MGGSYGLRAILTEEVIVNPRREFELIGPILPAGASARPEKMVNSHATTRSIFRMQDTPGRILQGHRHQPTLYRQTRSHGQRCPSIAPATVRCLQPNIWIFSPLAAERNALRSIVRLSLDFSEPSASAGAPRSSGSHDPSVYRFVDSPSFQEKTQRAAPVCSSRIESFWGGPGQFAATLSRQGLTAQPSEFRAIMRQNMCRAVINWRFRLRTARLGLNCFD